VGIKRDQQGKSKGILFSFQIRQTKEVDEAAKVKAPQIQQAKRSSKVKEPSP